MFENIEKKYRPIPFWSWNSKLDKEETVRQVKLMDEAGIGGFFMHARGGLTTEYMGEEWFENVTAAISEGNKKEMQPWAYDENGWPSGFGNGFVNGLGVSYQQKYLRCDNDIQNKENTICVIKDRRFYYEVNPYYVDTLNSCVTERFIEKIYQPYYDKYKNNFCGFFTDEPQISRNGIPWSYILPDEYKNEYKEDLLEHLNELFFAEGDFENTRLKFWRLITKLFSQNFMKKIFDWCVEHNLEFTGHMVEEETMLQQLTCNGACMPHYEYFTMPGMDWLGRNIYDCFTPLQVCSVAAQLGKKQVMSESFALSGHNVGFDELKAIYQWQMVHGVTRLCQHLEGYSLGGLRKRDYPPAMYYQQPWWKEYGIFNETVSRIGKILCEGEIRYDTLLLHTQTSAWKCFDNCENRDLKKYNDALLKDYQTLMSKHILFHFGDEIIMERHAFVDGKEMVIGNQRYSKIVIPENKGFFKNTQKLLDEFRANGGMITTADDIAFNDICSSDKIIYTERHFEGFKAYFFVNNNDETVEATFTKGSKFVNIETGEFEPFDRTYTFAPYDCIMIIDDGTEAAKKINKNGRKALDISGQWEIVNSCANILTIDTCDVYFDGKLEGKDENAVDVLYMALDLKKAVNIRLDYKFHVASVPKECCLVCETPEKFVIKVNDQEIRKTDLGYFVDKAFRKISLENKLCTGQNVISIEILFNPDDSIYDDMEKAFKFESEKNKLTFDVEFESIYIVGDFSVKTQGVFKTLDRNAVRYAGDFVIDDSKKEIALSNIEQQGFPFFSGRIKVKKVIMLDETDYEIRFRKRGVNAVNVTVNGQACGNIMWGHLSKAISDKLKVGENIIELELVNNLRNMLGPHHLGIGECHAVGPVHFYKRENIWTVSKWPKEDDEPWNNDYCFAEFGIYN